MRNKPILLLSSALLFGASMFVVNITNANLAPRNIYQSASPFDSDPFFQSDDDVFNQIKTLQQTMDRLMQQQFKHINHHMGFMNPNATLGSSQAIKMEEHNNELKYIIKQPEGSDSKVDVSVKNGLMIINTKLMQKMAHSENGSKSYSYSQRSYTRSFKLPSGYDPNSMDLTSKDSNLIVTFKKQTTSNSLKV